MLTYEETINVIEKTKCFCRSIKPVNFSGSVILFGSVYFIKGTRFAVVILSPRRRKPAEVVWLKKKKGKGRLFKKISFIEVLDDGSFIKPDYKDELLFHIDILSKEMI